MRSKAVNHAEDGLRFMRHETKGMIRSAGQT